MKSFTCIACLAAASQQRNGSDSGIPLTKIYGDLPEVPHDKFERWDRTDRIPPLKSRAYRVKNEDYYKLRTAEECKFPLDIVILQDFTDSFSDNINEMKNTQLKQMVEGLATTHPNSRFAVVGFQDKPIEKFGNRDDACWDFRSDFSPKLEDVYNAYADAVSYGGWDAPENQFGAIFAALDSHKMSWSSINSEYARLIVLVTDAGPHHAADGKAPADGRPMAPWPGSFNDDKAEELCLHTAYPSAQQVYNKLIEKQTYIASLVFDGDWANGWAAREWKEFNRFIAQPDEFVEPDAEDSSAFWAKLSKFIEALENVECGPESTSPAPVTTQGKPETTPAATTTTATLTSKGEPVSVTSTLPVTLTSKGEPVSVTTTLPVTTAPGTTKECNPTMITDGDCVPTAENCYCQPEVLIEIRENPDQMKLIADGKQLI